MTEQTLKDTFYLALRDRLAAVNPARTISLRGVLRPAMLVIENEFPVAGPQNDLPADCFHLRWTALHRDPDGLLHLHCDMLYSTAGTTGAGGLDRGRALAAMDAELIAVVNVAPQNTASSKTHIFWSDAAFADAAAVGDRLERSASVEVFSYA